MRFDLAAVSTAFFAVAGLSACSGEKQPAPPYSAYVYVEPDSVKVKAACIKDMAALRDRGADGLASAPTLACDTAIKQANWAVQTEAPRFKNKLDCEINTKIECAPEKDVLDGRISSEFTRLVSDTAYMPKVFGIVVVRMPDESGHSIVTGQPIYGQNSIYRLQNQSTVWPDQKIHDEASVRRLNGNLASYQDTFPKAE